MPRKLPAPSPCGCGCGQLTPRSFRPGHDMRVPSGAPCGRPSGRGSCHVPAEFAVGRVPSCGKHLASTVVEVANGERKATVRVLAPASPSPAPAPAPKSQPAKAA